MTNFNPNILWQSVLFFSGLGVFTGVTVSIVTNICLKLFRKKIIILKLFALVYLLIVCLSLFVLIVDFFVVDSRYTAINAILFLSLAMYFAHFSSTAHNGGAILSRLIKEKDH